MPEVRFYYDKGEITKVVSSHESAKAFQSRREAYILPRGQFKVSLDCPFFYPMAENHIL